MRRALLAAALCLTARTAAADSAVPAPPAATATLGNRVVDLATGRVVREVAGAPRCPDRPPWPLVDDAVTRRLAAHASLVRQNLSPQHATARHVLYTQTWLLGKTARSVVVDRRSGRAVLDLPERAVALFEDAAGGLDSLLALDEDGRAIGLLDGRTGAPRWRRAISESRSGYSDATPQRADDLLVIAFFHPIASGSALAAFDARTGEPRWVADVAQLQIPHSKYWNHVTLGLRGGTAVLLGAEAGGCHLQAFDVATGRRRFAILDPPPRPR